ncbi:hypothetical protein [Actinomadura yumaensis]|uniref:Secreted protein n=1 Tax=Actinomadura yumaensis TaxID=111807 RepID=A0ABW2CBV1_9ACTN
MTVVPQGTPAGPPAAPPPNGPPAQNGAGTGAQPAQNGAAGAAGAARPSRLELQRRAAARRPTGVARLLPRTVSGRVRTLAGAAVLVLVAVLAIAWSAIANARDGVRVIGHDAGPQVVTTGDLYFQLTDMDAQLANALLNGAGAGRDQALARYDQDRRKAGDALLKAANLADEATEKSTQKGAEKGTEEATARDLLDAFVRYERLAGQALLTDQRSERGAGPVRDEAMTLYRQATDLMKLDLLPKAYNLTLDNGTLVRHTYESKKSAVQTGRAWTLGVGALLLIVLVALQLYLAARFRRLLNPALAVATLGALALTAAAGVVLTGQTDHLRKAKEDGFDSMLALSRARAIGVSANADQTRFLLDPDRADTYEQVFLSKSQSVLYLAAGNLKAYNDALQKSAQEERPKILGFLGDERAHSSLPGQPRAFAKVVDDWRRYQRDDRTIRNLASSGQRAQAVAARAASARAFTAYDASLNELVAIHRTAFDGAVAEADDGTSGWYAVLPVAGLVIAALVLLGVRPRLTEYR